jgi:hypothetical protein
MTVTSGVTIILHILKVFSSCFWSAVAWREGKVKQMQPSDSIMSVWPSFFCREDDKRLLSLLRWDEFQRVEGGKNWLDG